MICLKCGIETERRSIDFSEPIFCFDCDPKNRCVDCGELRMRPIGHSEYCNDCFVKHQKEKIATIKSFGIIDNTRYGGTEMNETHYKDINTRVIDDYGNNLRGEKGLNYMKTKGNTYASRLKDYYK